MMSPFARRCRVRGDQGSSTSKVVRKRDACLRHTEETQLLRPLALVLVWWSLSSRAGNNCHHSTAANFNAATLSLRPTSWSVRQGQGSCLACIASKASGSMPSMF
jgi:hypothetical protein